MLSTLLFFLTLTADPAPKFKMPELQTQEQPTDSLKMITKTWVLREKLHAHKGDMNPVYPTEQMSITFRPNGSYSLVRQNKAPDAINGVEVIEEGRWELEASRGLIILQTRLVDGRSILSTMMPRWEVQELTEDKLVLRQFALSGQYLILEADKRK
ncbi:hypothetical protein POKO110462_18545 [Pontibacter korlensis]|uniref:Lipocalin-like domain-containing protein n=1 Tax=Pontibacter korlensis TaxID=400092 RepID=A0A0E3ZHM1_9BACT|nr:hypothetical protein [Pontibacter korlensis]AKD04883.1 hypothetical protein PKOR_19510 [Pontibacter korlensis]